MRLVHYFFYLTGYSAVFLYFYDHYNPMHVQWTGKKLGLGRFGIGSIRFGFDSK
jgi:hypothetical protein